MTGLTAIRHEFVEFIPDGLEEGVLYISIPYTTAAHLCACGCGEEVVTPLRPTEWRLIFDGETVSLKPSIGNGSFACRSHYWIERDRILWHRPMSRREIEAARSPNRMSKAGDRQVADHAPESPAPRKGLLRRLLDMFSD